MRVSQVSPGSLGVPLLPLRCQLSLLPRLSTGSTAFARLLAGRALYSLYVCSEMKVVSFVEGHNKLAISTESCLHGAWRLSSCVVTIYRQAVLWVHLVLRNALPRPARGTVLEAERGIPLERWGTSRDQVGTSTGHSHPHICLQKPRVHAPCQPPALPGAKGYL